MNTLPSWEEARSIFETSVNALNEKMSDFINASKNIEKYPKQKKEFMEALLFRCNEAGDQLNFMGMIKDANPRVERLIELYAIHANNLKQLKKLYNSLN